MTQDAVAERTDTVSVTIDGFEISVPLGTLISKPSMVTLTPSAGTAASWLMLIP